MHKTKIANGMWWVDIPEAGLYVLCGCPADSVKHLYKRGFIMEIERDGVVFETGPNAILLSDIPIQGGEFSNLAEFPILQMLYRQGLGLPGHPRNDGTRPMLIGVDEQVQAQSGYILRGNYGLSSIEELVESGTSPETAASIMRMKLRFAFGRMRETSEVLELRAVGTETVELRRGAFIRRISFNVYEFMRGTSSVIVDLNLPPGTSFESPYSLPPRLARREYFSVVHIGEGEGWDSEKPCMGSIVVFQGKLYLVDAGPNILGSLTALGIGVNEVEGIFQTHAHDDHFAGLTSLVRSDHRLRYYAAPAVRASVAKKLSMLMGFNEGMFGRYFEVVDLALDEWNDIDGLEVRPVLSAHPVETTVLFFRAFGAGGATVYAHLSDIPSFEVLRSMVSEDPAEPGVSSEFRERFERELLSRADVKKIDAGGGAIHGSAQDFSGDSSPRILISHVTGKLSDAQKRVGSSAAFGQEDVLIAGAENYALQAAFRHLCSYFSTPANNVRMLLNCPESRFASGSLILRKGEAHEEIYFIVQGIVEVLDIEDDVHGTMGVGSLIGEYSALHGISAIRTFRAVSDVSTLRIPTALYAEFLRRTGLAEEARQVLENRQFLQDTWLFGEMISFPLLRSIAQNCRTTALAAGRAAFFGGGLHMVREGRLELVSEAGRVSELRKGTVFGGDLASAAPVRLRARAVCDSVALSIPEKIIRDIPIVQWKLLETHRKRFASGARRDSQSGG
jgi:hemerythrin